MGTMENFMFCGLDHSQKTTRRGSRVVATFWRTTWGHGHFRGGGGPGGSRLTGEVAKSQAFGWGREHGQSSRARAWPEQGGSPGRSPEDTLHFKSFLVKTALPRFPRGLKTMPPVSAKNHISLHAGQGSPESPLVGLQPCGQHRAWPAAPTSGGRGSGSAGAWLWDAALCAHAG